MAKSKKAVAAQAEIQMNMVAAVDLHDATDVELAGESVMLANLLDEMTETQDDLAALDADLGEIVEHAAEAAIDADALLTDAIAAVEMTEAKQALYAEQEAPEVDASAPVTPPEGAPQDAVEPAAKGKKEKKAKAPKEPKPPKEPRATKVTHKPGDLLKVKLGGAANDYLVFSAKDAAELGTVELEAKANAFIERMNDREAIADKVREKITMFLTWLQKGGELNEVMKRSLTVLAQTGELTSGDKGNLQLNLLAKPYSLGTARSQANQMFMAFPELGLTVKEKGRMVPNPDSTLLPIALGMLGLA